VRGQVLNCEFGVEAPPDARAEPFRIRRRRPWIGRAFQIHDLTPICLSALVLVGVPSGWAQTSSGEIPRAKLEAVEAAVSAEMSRQGIPGLSIAIGQGGQIRFTSGYGLADLENTVPAKAATVYRLASVSKPITATAVLQLVERGALDLDAPIQKYVSSFPEKPWPVTARMLLGHLGGVRHYRDDEPTSTRPYGNATEALILFRDDPLVVEPNTRFLYSTYGYNLLGAAIEGVTGKPFIEALKEGVFGPAAMVTTRVDEVAPLIPNRAQGYIRLPSGEVRNSALADVSNKVPGGGLCSTAADVARFGMALGGGTLLKRETLAQMLTSQKTRDGRLTSYGFGLNVAAPGRRKEAWHTGGQERVSTVLYLQPDSGLVVVLLTNLQHSSLTDLARRVADLLTAETVVANPAAVRP
jgi:CubicO group peptidase (beta-lactamase class C family)